MEDLTQPSTSASIDSSTGVTSIGGSRRTRINRLDGNFIECLNVNLPKIKDTLTLYNDTKSCHYFEDSKVNLRRALCLHYACKGSWSCRQLHLEWDEDNLLEDYYVPLEFNILTRNGKEVKEANLKLHHIFGATPLHKRSAQRVLIQGHTGHGKSSLCDKIANEWASPSADFPNLSTDFELVILVRLMDVHTTIEDEIVRMCNNISVGQYEYKDLMDIFKNSGDKVLLILDGYNDANKHCRDSVDVLLGHQKTSSHFQNPLRQAKIILTSRPLLPREVYQYFDRFMSIAFLPFQSQLTYVHKYFINNPEKEKEMISIIQKRNEWFEQSYPLFFHVLCFLHKQGVVLDEDSTNFWERFLSFVETRNQSQREINCVDFQKLKHHLGKMCYQSLKAGQHYIEIKDISQLHVFGKEEVNFIKTCGIFSLEHSFLYPIHKMLMEYLAQQYLQKHWNELQDELDRREFMSTLQLSDTVHTLITDKLFCSWIRIMRNSMVFILCLTKDDNEITSSQSKFIQYDEQQEYLSYIENRVAFSASILMEAKLSAKEMLQKFISGVDDHVLPANGFRYLSYFQENEMSQFRLHIRCDKNILDSIPDMLRQTYDFRFKYTLDLFSLPKSSEEYDHLIVNTFQRIVEVPPFAVRGHMERRLLMKFLENPSMRYNDSFRLVINGLTKLQVVDVKNWMQDAFHNVVFKKLSNSRRQLGGKSTLSSTEDINLTKIFAIMAKEDPELVQERVDFALSAIFKTVKILKELKCDPMQTFCNLLNVEEEEVKMFFNNFGRVMDDKDIVNAANCDNVEDELVQHVTTTYRVEIQVQEFSCQNFSIKKNKEDSLLFPDEKIYFEFELLGSFNY